MQEKILVGQVRLPVRAVLYVGDGRILMLIRVLWGHKVVLLMAMFLFFYQALIRVVFLFDQLDWLCR